MNHGPSFIEDVSQRNKGIGAWNEQTCEPELPHDTAEEVFMDAKLRVRLPDELKAFTTAANLWCLEVFREFWKDYEAQEGSSHSSRSFGDEAAIRLLQALTRSRSRRTAMLAECYLAVINRKGESQTQIAARYAVSKAAISKIIVGIKDDLQLPTARHMKSDAARQSYRERALRIHKIKKTTTCNEQNSNSFSRLSTLKHLMISQLVKKS